MTAERAHQMKEVKAKSPSSDATIVDLRQPKNPELEKLSERNKQTSHERDFFEQLLQIEARIRSMASLEELKYCVVNELHSILPCDQIILMTRKLSRSKYAIDKVSNLAVPDNHSPLMQWLGKELNEVASAHQKTDEGASVKSFRLRIETAPHSGFVATNGILRELQDRQGQTFGMLVCLSGQAFSYSQISLMDRLAGTISHAWLAFEKPRSVKAIKFSKPARYVLSLGILLLAFVPVPLTVLAPMVIVPDEPSLVTAPINGIVKNIHTAPNTRVDAGEILFTFDNTDAVNLVDQAERQFAIAGAKLRRANQDAFGSGDGRKDMAVAKAELDLAQAEMSAAKRKLELVDVKAQTSGLVLFDSKEQWVGKPVSIGERIMRIADPDKIKFQLDLPTDEAIILSQMSTAKIFLDSDPLNPFEVPIERSSYEAKLSDANILAFPIFAVPENIDTQHNLRIGLRGTAQLSGNKVPLWFFIFRKPLSFLRHFTGL